MDANAQPSFIPHDAGTPASTRRRSGGLMDLLLILAILAFAASAALAVGVFLYHQYLSSVAAADLAKLKRAEESFQPALISQLERLDNRMHSAEAILSKHLAPSAFFTVLDAITAKTVSYSSLNITVADRIKLDMDGVAQSVNSVAFQADLLSKDGTYQNPIFSNLDRQKDGVHFHLAALINPDSINFQSLTGGGASSLEASVRESVRESTSTLPQSSFGTAPAAQ